MTKAKKGDVNGLDASDLAKPNGLVGRSRYKQKTIKTEDIDKWIAGRDPANLHKFFKDAENLVYDKKNKTSSAVSIKDYFFKGANALASDTPIDFFDPESLKALCNQTAEEKARLLEEGFADQYLEALFGSQKDDKVKEETIGLIAAGFSNLLNCKEGRKWLGKGENLQRTTEVVSSLSKEIKNPESLSRLAACFASVNHKQEKGEKENRNSKELMQQVISKIVESGKEVAEKENPAQRDVGAFCHSVAAFSYHNKENATMFSDQGAEKSLVNFAKQSKGANNSLATNTNICVALLNLNHNSKSDALQDPEMRDVLSGWINDSIKALASNPKSKKDAFMAMSAITCLAVAMTNDPSENIYKAAEVKGVLVDALAVASKAKLATKDAQDQLLSRVIYSLAHVVNKPQFDAQLFDSMLDASKEVTSQVAIARCSHSIAKSLNCEGGVDWLRSDENYHKAQDVVAGYYKHASDPKDLEEISHALSVINRGRQMALGLQEAPEVLASEPGPVQEPKQEPKQEPEQEPKQEPETPRAPDPKQEPEQQLEEVFAPETRASDAQDDVEGVGDDAAAVASDIQDIPEVVTSPPVNAKKGGFVARAANLGGDDQEDQKSWKDRIGKLKKPDAHGKSVYTENITSKLDEDGNFKLDAINLPPKVVIDKGVGKF